MQNKIQIEVLVESSKNCSRSRIVAALELWPLLRDENISSRGF